MALILAMAMTAMPPAFATEADDPNEGIQEPAAADERGTAPPLVTDVLDAVVDSETGSEPVGWRCPGVP